MDLSAFRPEIAFIIIAAGIGYFGGMFANYVWWYLQKKYSKDINALHLMGILHLLFFLGMLVGVFFIMYYGL